MTPRPVIAVAWILFCGVYGIRVFIEQGQWVIGALGLGFLLAGLGVVMRWRWSQWLVYALCAVWIGSWLYGVYLAIRAGAFPSGDLEITTLQLVPGLAIVAAMVWSADTVRRRFASPIEQTQRDH